MCGPCCACCAVPAVLCLPMGQKLPHRQPPPAFRHLGAAAGCTRSPCAPVPPCRALIELLARRLGWGRLALCWAPPEVLQVCGPLAPPRPLKTAVKTAHNSAPGHLGCCSRMACPPRCHKPQPPGMPLLLPCCCCCCLGGH